MNKNTLLKLIAEKGYIISYAANLNFSTYDIVTGLPPKVTYISLAISIISLVCQVDNANWIAVPILLLSIACLFTEKYNEKILEYMKRGNDNTKQWNELKRLYFKVKDSDENLDFTEIETRLQAIETEFNNDSESDQIVFANWYAHYKLFCEKDYAWMDEQIHFGFWKDKVPRSLEAMLLAGIVVGLCLFCVKCPIVSAFFKEMFSFCFQ